MVSSLALIHPFLAVGSPPDLNNLRIWVFFEHSENCAPTADLDVIGVGPERQDLLRPTSVPEDGYLLHAPPFSALHPLWVARFAASTPPRGSGRANRGPREAACP